MWKNSNPWFLVNGKNLEALFVVRGSDHGNFTQTFGNTCIDIIGISVPEVVLNMGIFLLKRRNRFGKKLGTIAFDRCNIKGSL